MGSRVDKAECRALRAQGWPLNKLAERYGVSRPRICTICKGVVCPKNLSRQAFGVLAERRRTERDQRRAHALELQRQGVSICEIGLRLGVTRSSVFSYLRGSETSSSVEIPAWVPAFLHETYREIGGTLGEEEAASAVRHLKSEAAAQCR